MQSHVNSTTFNVGDVILFDTGNMLPAVAAYLDFVGIPMNVPLLVFERHKNFARDVMWLMSVDSNILLLPSDRAVYAKRVI